MTEQQARGIDAEARRRILDIGQSFIVQAPAGAGKTELLIQRYLALLAVVDSPEEIVAITFTRKAAAEMRSRVLAALASAHQDLDGLKEHQLLTRNLAVHALERDARLGWKLEQHPARMRIMTIDALNGWLARQLPWQSGMGGQIAVSDQAVELHLEAARATLQGKGCSRLQLQHIERLLVHLDNGYERIEERVASLLAVRDQWLRLLTGGSHPAREVLESALAAVVEAQLAAVAAAIPASVAAVLPALAVHAASQLAAVDALTDGHALLPCMGMTELPGTDTAALAGWQSLAALLLTSDNSLRKPKGVNKNLGFPAGDNRKADFQNLLEHLSGEADFIVALGKVRLLPSPSYDDRQWEMLGTIVDIMFAAVENLRELFVARGIVDHTEVAASALNALGEDLLPTDLALILEHRIQHLLVDEFQDTSTGQFALLERLTAAWTEGDGHSLFLVGDPMQSIYRFREAEVGLFLRAWSEERIGNVPLAPLRLTLNFRSVPGIVDWINDTFSRILPSANDPATGAVSYAPCLAAQSHDPESDASADTAVRMQLHFAGSTADEAAFIAREVCAILDDPAREKSKDPAVGILVRARAHLAPIAAALREAGRRFRAVDIEALATTPVVRDLLALTLTLLHPGDRLSGFAVLRSRFCGLSLETLSIIAGQSTGRAVLDVAQSCLDQHALPEADILRLHRCLSTLREAYALRGSRTLRLLVEGCWLELGGPLCTDEAGNAAVAAYLDALEGCDDGGDITDLREIHSRIEALFVPSDPLGDVDLQLMTMHKAKGLQFDTVVLPRLEATGRAQSDMLLLWHQRARRGGTDFLLAPVAEKGHTNDATYAWIKQSLKEKDEHERLRLLYVGATRARKQLLLTGNLRVTDKEGDRTLATPRSASFLGILWPLVELEADAQFLEYLGRVQAGEAPVVQPSERTPQQLARLPLEWTLPEWPPDVRGEHGRFELQGVDDELRRSPFRAGEHARVTGIVVHRLLAMLAEDGAAGWLNRDEAWRRACVTAVLRQTAAISESDALIDHALEAVRKTLADDRGRWMLAARAMAAQEWKLSAFHGGEVVNIVIDRTFVDEDGTRWIVDYKTAAHEGAGTEEFLARQQEVYTPQLRRYGEIAHAFDGRPVRLGLYFPMLQEWREVESK